MLPAALRVQLTRCSTLRSRNSAVLAPGGSRSTYRPGSLPNPLDLRSQRGDLLMDMLGAGAINGTGPGGITEVARGPEEGGLRVVEVKTTHKIFKKHRKKRTIYRIQYCRRGWENGPKGANHRDLGPATLHTPTPEKYYLWVFTCSRTWGANPQPQSDVANADSQAPTKLWQ